MAPLLPTNIPQSRSPVKAPGAPTKAFSFLSFADGHKRTPELCLAASCFVVLATLPLLLRGHAGNETSGSWLSFGLGAGKALPQWKEVVPPVSLESGEVPCITPPGWRQGYAGDKYLLLSRLGPDLIEAKMFLAEAAALANKVNRVLVIPDLKTHHAKRSQPFCQYFDATKLNGFVRWIPEEQYAAEVLASAGPNSTLEFAAYGMLQKREGAECADDLAAMQTLKLAKLITLRIRTVHCINQPLGTNYIGSRTLERKERALLRALTSGKAARARFLVLHKSPGDEDHPLLPKNTTLPVREHLHYAQHIVDLAEQVQKSLGPEYLGLHWRMGTCLRREDCSPSVLQGCVRGAMRRLVDKQKLTNLTTVFISTDAPLNEPDDTYLEEGGMPLDSARRGGLVLRSLLEKIEEAPSRDGRPPIGVTLDMVLPKVTDFGVQQLLRALLMSQASESLETDYPCSGWDESMLGEIKLLRKASQRKPSERFEQQDGWCEQAEASRTHGAQPDKYLAVLGVAEQLTKAKMHFSESMALAKRLNRTIVLPRVGGSAIGLHRETRFCNYLDPKKVGEYWDWVTLDGLKKEWQDYDDELPTGFVLILHPPDNSLRCADYLKKWDWAGLRQVAQVGPADLACIEQPGTWHSVDPAKLMATEEKILQIAQRRAAKKDVLFFNKVAYEEFITPELSRPALAHLQYAPWLQEQADKLLTRLGPDFIAIQWRMEKCVERPNRDEAYCTDKLLKRCTTALLDAVTAFRTHHGNNQTVFFATDAPYPAAGIKGSQSFPEGRRKQASKMLKPVMAALQPVTWESFDSTLREADPGVQSILDKLVLTEAKHLLVAAYPCSGWSSFVDEIKSLRKSRNGDEGMQMWGGSVPLS